MERREERCEPLPTNYHTVKNVWNYLRDKLTQPFSIARITSEFVKLFYCVEDPLLVGVSLVPLYWESSNRGASIRNHVARQLTLEGFALLTFRIYTSNNVEPRMILMDMIIIAADNSYYALTAQNRTPTPNNRSSYSLRELYLSSLDDIEVLGTDHSFDCSASLSAWNNLSGERIEPRLICGSSISIDMLNYS